MVSAKMNLWFHIFLVQAVFIALGKGQGQHAPGKAPEMWMANIGHGKASFNARPNDYKVYRNVIDFGCRGDGVTDDTSCINTAISSGGRCGDNCGSSTVSPALIYFPSGRYLVSSPIIMYYFSQLVGNANDPPTIIAHRDFSGIAVIDVNPYKEWGRQWYTNQNNFFRQIRNFIIDLTQTAPGDKDQNGIHWQVAQATSLHNIFFKMSPYDSRPGNVKKHRGIFIENGSGGFMSNLTFENGQIGMNVGNQQFLSRNLVFNNVDTAITIFWDWQWSFKSVTIRKSRIGFNIEATNDKFASGVGSLLLADSEIIDTQVGISSRAPGKNTDVDKSGTILLDNVKIQNVGDTVKDVNGGTVLAGAKRTIQSWGRGSVYTDKKGRGKFQIGNLPSPPKKPGPLLDNVGKFFEKSRPQYEKNSVNDFANVQAFGAKGDGRSDDTAAIQSAINDSRNKKIVYFPAGNYIITNTVYVPSGSRLIGECWSVLTASGTAFGSPDKAVPMLQVGKTAEVGTVEITDFMFGTKGPAPGAILVQWNMRQASGKPGSVGMWDSHFRVGGYAGSELQAGNCPKGQSFNAKCFGAHTLLHVTRLASGYFENVWAWTADHDLDNQEAQGQVTVYTGRGVNVESSPGPVWLYGTQSEHNVLYQYNIANASNVYMTMIQSETPYWQPGPPAPNPFPVQIKFSDPNYDHCPANNASCPMSWGLRSVRSSNVFVYGAGMYNFFNNYDTTCQATESCQQSMVSLEDNKNLYMYNINTKSATNMVVGFNTQIYATQADNKNNFCQTINAFLAEAA